MIDLQTLIATTEAANKKAAAEGATGRSRIKRRRAELGLPGEYIPESIAYADQVKIGDRLHSLINPTGAPVESIDTAADGTITLHIAPGECAPLVELVCHPNRPIPRMTAAEVKAARLEELRKTPLAWADVNGGIDSGDIDRLAKTVEGAYLCGEMPPVAVYRAEAGKLVEVKTGASQTPFSEDDWATMTVWVDLPGGRIEASYSVDGRC